MTRDRWQSEIERLGKFPDRSLAARQSSEDRPPRWIGQRGESRIE
jgi:hypothetical protein